MNDPVYLLASGLVLRINRRQPGPAEEDTMVPGVKPG